MKNWRVTRFLKKYWYTVGIAGLIIVGALAVFAQQQSPPNTQTLQPETPITHSTSTPDESKPNASAYHWNGPADEPKKLRIKKLGIDTFIQKLGVDQNNQVAVPSNVHLAGWFNQSAKPGQPGLAVIAGHVSGNEGEGIFKQLAQLASGDTFEVTLGSGAIKSYKILDSKKVTEAKAVAYLFSQQPNVPSQLNLITCAGTFDASRNQYPDRLIVEAQLQ